MMQIINTANDLLQRIADLGNWLTSDEIAPVRDEYNALVSVFISLERTFRFTFGDENINVQRKNCPNKKSVLDFVKWNDDGKILANNLIHFLAMTKLDFVREDDKKYVRGGWNKIRELCDAVMNMGVTAPKKEVW